LKSVIKISSNLENVCDIINSVKYVFFVMGKT